MSPQQSTPGFRVFPGSIQVGEEGPRLQPSIVLLLGWMDAPLSLLNKYVDGHRSLFPTSIVVLVESHSSFMWATSHKKERNLRPVIDILVDKLYTTTSGPKNGLLVHAISNAGAIHLMTLASFLRQRLDEIHGSELTTLPTITMAFSRLPLTFAYVAYYLIYNKTLNNPPLLPLLHGYLEQRKLLPRSDEKTPRLYIYSDADLMIPWSSVEKHMLVLSQIKIPFMMEKYIGTQHVSHAKQDPKRYWEAVHSVWRSALGQKNMPEFMGKL